MRINIYQPLAIHELGKRANQEDSIYPIVGKATENDRLFRSVFLMFLRMYFLYTLCHYGSMRKGYFCISNIRQIVDFCLENNMIRLV